MVDGKYWHDRRRDSEWKPTLLYFFIFKLFSCTFLVHCALFVVWSLPNDSTLPAPELAATASSISSFSPFFLASGLSKSKIGGVTESGCRVFFFLPAFDFRTSLGVKRPILSRILKTCDWNRAKVLHKLIEPYLSTLRLRHWRFLWPIKGGGYFFKSKFFKSKIAA